MFTELCEELQMSCFMFLTSDTHNWSLLIDTDICAWLCLFYNAINIIFTHYTPEMTRHNRNNKFCILILELKQLYPYSMSVIRTGPHTRKNLFRRINQCAPANSVVWDHRPATEIF
jgi:hypothetical protein